MQKKKKKKEKIWENDYYENALCIYYTKITIKRPNNNHENAEK